VFTKRKELLKGGLNKDIKKRMVKALIWIALIVWSVALYAAGHTGHTGKKISRDWRLLRCGCREGWKRSVGET